MSIISSMRYCLGPPDSFGPIWAALGFMPFGLFFDFMDGKVARWRGKSSLMGQELDSLADLVRQACRATVLHESMDGRLFQESITIKHRHPQTFTLSSTPVLVPITSSTSAVAC